MTKTKSQKIIVYFLKCIKSVCKAVPLHPNFGVSSNKTIIYAENQKYCNYCAR